MVGGAERSSWSRSESFARAAQHRIRLASQDQLTHLDLEILGCASGLRPSLQLEHETHRPIGRGQQQPLLHSPRVPCHLGCDVAVVASDKRNVVAPELLIEAARAGEVVDCSDGDGTAPSTPPCCGASAGSAGTRSTTAACSCATPSSTGELDLSAMRVPFPLTFEECQFEAPLQISGVTLQELTVLRCDLPGLLGNGVDVRRDLNLSGSTVTGALPTTASQSRTAAIWLCESQVGGRLLVRGHRHRARRRPGDPGRPYQGRGHRPAHP